MAEEKNGNGVQQVPSVPLVPRDAGGLGGALFALLDDVMGGKNVPVQKVNIVCNIARTYGSLVRTAIAQERHRAAGNTGLTIDHEEKSEAPNNGTNG